MVKKAYMTVRTRCKGVWQAELALDFAIRFANQRRRTHYGIAAAKREDRCPDVVRFRMDLCWALRNICGWSYPRIGAAIERDHSSVMHLCDKFEGNQRLHRKSVQRSSLHNAKRAARTQNRSEPLGASM